MLALKIQFNVSMFSLFFSIFQDNIHRQLYLCITYFFFSLWPYIFFSFKVLRKIVHIIIRVIHKITVMYIQPVFALHVSVSPVTFLKISSTKFTFKCFAYITKFTSFAERGERVGSVSYRSLDRTRESTSGMVRAPEQNAGDLCKLLL